ncbi:ester cyclase [Streptomyces sp. GESEQ-35]|uniref:ester cyclase n=1 Tax=Streptomyces sp. GESEQ-35 TaxID=2812657 RepID=UPI001B336226|nr:ester cyclase [Streptomyces sp. GESEQ-35]
MHPNEKIARRSYELAEVVDAAGFIDAFTEDGTFNMMTVPITYRGAELGTMVESLAAAFPDMHRELRRVYVVGKNMVMVELRLQGTHLGPFRTANGILQPTGRRVDVPTLDMIEIVGDKIKQFDCYPMGTVRLRQLGVPA